MITMIRQVALTFMLSLLAMLPAASPQADSQHAVVTGVKMIQLIDKQKVKFSWDEVSTAKKYRIKILQGSTRIARKFVENPKAKFKETKFKDNLTYTVYVRAKGNARYARNNWTTYSFVYFDEDHDNDLIPDSEDYDDDNDGIPDTIDSDPYGVSGTVYSVVIENNSLQNGTITILQNDTVTWVNKDEGGHSVSASNKSWYSPPLQRNESYSHIFDAVGVYTYSDPTYPGVTTMTGTITVNSQ